MLFPAVVKLLTRFALIQYVVKYVIVLHMSRHIGSLHLPLDKYDNVFLAYNAESVIVFK